MSNIHEMINAIKDAYKHYRDYNGPNDEKIRLQGVYYSLVRKLLAFLEENLSIGPSDYQRLNSLLSSKALQHIGRKELQLLLAQIHSVRRTFSQLTPNVGTNSGNDTAWLALNNSIVSQAVGRMFIATRGLVDAPEKTLWKKDTLLRNGFTSSGFWKLEGSPLDKALTVLSAHYTLGLGAAIVHITGDPGIVILYSDCAKATFEFHYKNVLSILYGYKVEQKPLALLPKSLRETFKSTLEYDYEKPLRLSTYL